MFCPNCSSPLAISNICDDCNWTSRRSQKTADTAMTAETPQDPVIEALLEVGSRWTKYGHDRIYFSDDAMMKSIDATFEYYSRRELGIIGVQVARCKAYYDIKTGEIVIRNAGSRIDVEIMEEYFQGIIDAATPEEVVEKEEAQDTEEAQTAAATIESAAIETADECWNVGNDDDRDELARASQDASRWAAVTDGLPFDGDIEHAEEKIGRSLTDDESDSFLTEYLGHLERLAEEHYRSEVEQEDASLKALAESGDLDAMLTTHALRV